MNIEDIFSRAVEIKAEAVRGEYLDKACAGEPALRQRVESLLAAHEEAASFLENPVKTLAAETTAPGGRFSPVTALPPSAYRPISEGPGTMVGRYKLLQQIGEGGMGVVYMAAQETPVRRRVALKIIKPGMDSAQVIARFEAERQALAMMDHPNIARVLDAGTTETGRPYFVMELVQGIPITQYCDDKLLNTVERLELFIQVCNAIQHAHQKGIIHRDLKPSNVLIAIYDGKPVPKIIDFGVAKALHQNLTEKTMFTQFGAVVGTLEYMSPEQADMDLMGTDTRSDIYSLGVLLYELLTGSTPLDGKKLRSLGYAEMLKTIREVDPPKPSTRLTQSRDDMATISARRQTEPRRLQKLVAGDLDWIVMKCLEKDRTRRYETANGLAVDIQRHLQDEAVLASPPGQLYKLQKLVRRNKLMFAAIACVMLALVLGLAASLWQAERAHREAMRAASEAERASTEATRCCAAEEQALMTLDELRATAPTFVAQAQALAAEGKIDEAIEKLDYVIRLHPEAAEFRVAKGDLYLGQLKLSDAAIVYRDALRLKPGFRPAQTKATLCEQILAASPSPQGKFSLESLVKIYAAGLLGKPTDAALKAVSDTYAQEKKRLWNSWLPRLQALPMFANLPAGDSQWEHRFDVRNDGQLILYLGQMDPGDLSQLKGLPVAELYLSNSLNVTDVLPLADMASLESLTIPMLVRNIEALHKLPKLKRLSFTVTQPRTASDQMNQQEIYDYLNANGEDSLRTGIFDIAGNFQGRPTPDTTAEEFWKQYSTLTWVARLRDSGLKIKKLWSRNGDAPGTWGLDLRDTGIRDLSILKGMPLTALWLDGDPVTDLGPLHGMPLTNFYIDGTKVSDLSPLEGMQLAELWMDGTPVADLSPLRGMHHLSILKLAGCNNITDLSPVAEDKGLHWLFLPPHVKDIHILRTLPNLEIIGFGYNTIAPADFFRLYDTAQWQSALHIAGVNPGEMIRRDDGTWILDVSNRKDFADLTPLHGIPISILSIGNTSVTDLSPVRGMPLKEFRLWNTKVTDLTPIKGMAITVLDMGGVKVKDLSPLKGMPLDYLCIDNTDVSDLSPLRGMPLTTLRLRGCDNLTNLSPLTDVRNLSQLVLPPDFTDFAFLHTLPSLQRLSYDEDERDEGKGPNKTTDEFWAFSASLAAQEHVLSVLKKEKIKYKLLVQGDGSWDLTVDHQPLSDLSILKSANITSLTLTHMAIFDLSPLRGMKLSQLRLTESKVTDLSPLAGMSLNYINISDTDISELKPLIGMPLTSIRMANCERITDLSPLAGTSDTLESIILPPNAKNIEFLRKFPKLKRISFQYDPNLHGPAQSVGEFWFEYDQNENPTATQPVSADHGP